MAARVVPMKPRAVPGPPHLLSVGSFGRAVAQYLSALCPKLVETRVTDDTIVLPTMWPSCSTNFLASWRPVPHLCGLLDELSFKWERPFVPIILDSTFLRVGPVVAPRYGPCWGCWMSRSTQHDDWSRERLALFDFYASHPDEGPRGYLEPFAMMAASRMAAILEAVKSSNLNAAAGHIWQIDMLTREITTATVIGVDDCSRCGLHRPPATRSFAVMQKELAYLWAEQSDQERRDATSSLPDRP
jgi:bacteriocin biosynthesis cyclodehydratase domain-containing protein